MAGLVGGQIKPLAAEWQRRFTCLDCGLRFAFWESFRIHRERCRTKQAWEREAWEEARAGD